MESIEIARGVYEDTVEEQGSVSAQELAVKLLEQVQDIRGIINGNTEEVSDEVTDIFKSSEEFDIDRVTDVLEGTANDLRDVLGQSNITINELPNGIAGQAQLDGGLIDIDPNSIQSDGNRIIDRGVAEDIRDHEIEHTKQSSSVNSDGIEVYGHHFDSREIREAAAISVQHKTSFLSSEYQRITANLPMDANDRELVRNGKFKELEKRKNGLN